MGKTTVGSRVFPESACEGQQVWRLNPRGNIGNFGKQTTIRPTLPTSAMLFADRTGWWKCAYAVTLLLAVSLTFFQVSQLALRYWAAPKTTFIAIEHERSIPAPALTFCLTPNRNATSRVRYEVVHFIRRGGLHDRHITPKMPMPFYTEYGFWEERSMRGIKPCLHLERICRCYTFNPNVSISMGPYSGYMFHFRVQEMEKMRMSPVVEMIVHDRDSSVSDLGPYTYSATQLAIGETFHAAFRRRVVRRLDPPGKSCSRASGYNQMKCLERCVSDWIQENATCVVPYLLKTPPEKPPCPGSANETGEAFNAFLDRYSSASDRLKRGWPRCDCPRPCDAVEYHVAFRPHARIKIQPNEAVLYAYFDSSQVEIFEEQWAYSLIQFLADIGGFTGIFLGVSVMSAYAFLERVAATCLSHRPVCPILTNRIFANGAACESCRVFGDERNGAAVPP